MLIDLRTYTLKIGSVRDFLALYAAEGLAVQTAHLGPPLGYYTTEVGELSQVVHLWQYQDAADRERRRAALEADPRWLAYRSKSSVCGHVVRQQNSLLKAVDFAAMVPGMASKADQAQDPRRFLPRQDFFAQQVG